MLVSELKAFVAHTAHRSELVDSDLQSFVDQASDKVFLRFGCTIAVTPDSAVIPAGTEQIMKSLSLQACYEFLINGEMARYYEQQAMALCDAATISGGATVLDLYPEGPVIVSEDYPQEAA